MIEGDLTDTARLASLGDETPEGRSIVVLAGIGAAAPATAAMVAFTAQTRVSGIDIGDRQIRKGAVEAILKLRDFDADAVRQIRALTEKVARASGTPLAVADGDRLLGAIALKDIVKAGIKERFAELRRMGIRTVMITGDTPLTAAAIAAESGVDDSLAVATPEEKLASIRAEQAGGKLVAMCGDGTNDAPPLAPAHVGVAINTGTQAAREAGNMVDLDSNPA
ncbi:ATPase, P-type (transporting), HAD superfamily, subfamily IC [Loktanella fryxellensis]|uniref:ATPase, P-type (Transporting), HAD superfamily, subfamily IC n=1 Tax=Loktanella fryxellensis TaxID=245187 RepID=A0A1H8JA54_9RHOB|nr:ATPase, P-type (transporting), HAD superfamily, subfamily IC [Loktanella fryxellensis]